MKTVPIVKKNPYLELGKIYAKSNTHIYTNIY